MRISTSQIFDRNIAALQNNQAQLTQTQLQVASGKKMLKPSDDPVRAARSLGRVPLGDEQPQEEVERGACPADEGQRDEAQPDEPHVDREVGRET